jgi:hypothetical protein
VIQQHDTLLRIFLARVMDCSEDANLVTIDTHKRREQDDTHYPCISTHSNISCVIPTATYEL